MYVIGHKMLIEKNAKLNKIFVKSYKNFIDSYKKKKGKISLRYIYEIMIVTYQ